MRRKGLVGWPRRARATAAALGLLAAAGCAGNSGPPAPVSIPGAVVNKGVMDDSAQAQAVTATIKVGDSWFSPTFIKAAPGARITVQLTDTGQIAHTFTVDSQKVDVVLDKAGQHRTITLVMPAGGQPVVFYCKYHQSAGMQGALYSR